jgi:putative transposon-encoded protein
MNMYSCNIVRSSVDDDCLDLFLRAIIGRAGDMDCPRDLFGCNMLIRTGDKDCPRIFVGCKVATTVCRRRPLFFFDGFEPAICTANRSLRGNRS